MPRSGADTDTETEMDTEERGRPAGTRPGGLPAARYAAGGLRVFPVHGVLPDPGGGWRCTCAAGAGCLRAGKHPLTAHGLRDATRDAATIAAWWRRWPEANIGVATGRHAPGGAAPPDVPVVVLDIDGLGGEATIEALQGRHGQLPETWAVLTGGGGFHLWFAHPGAGRTVKTSAGALGPGLDMRGDGGYVVVPPSGHRSGNRYVWAETWRPGSVPLADMPGWLLDLTTGGDAPGPPRPAPDATRSRVNASPDDILPEGRRNAGLTILAGSLRWHGLSADAIEAALLVENERRCRPPLPEPEVRRIAESVGRYPAGAGPSERLSGRWGGAGGASGFGRAGAARVNVELVNGEFVVRGSGAGAGGTR